MEKERLLITQACRNRFMPVTRLVNQMLKSDVSPILIGIDGMCASGKTTLGYYLKNEFDCNLFHMDDFFLQEHQRTQKRLGEIGGNVDYERFQEEVIYSILNQQKVKYRPYDCSLGTIQAGKEISYKRLNVIEGSYCQNPYFGEIYQARIFMSISEQVQIERISIRNGNTMLKRFQSEWIPKENAYFEKFQIKNNSILIENS